MLNLSAGSSEFYCLSAKLGHSRSAESGYFQSALTLLDPQRLHLDSEHQWLHGSQSYIQTCRSIAILEAKGLPFPFVSQISYTGRLAEIERYSRFFNIILAQVEYRGNILSCGSVVSV